MRHLYLWFVLAFAIMAYGFSPDLYGEFGPVDALRWVHGALAAGWMALLIGQSWLIGHGGWKWHGRLGRASRYVVPLLVISAFLVVRDMLGPNSHFDRDLRLGLAWADILSLLLFSALYVCAILYRRRFVLHARFIASTVFVVLPPAIGRALSPLFGGLAPALQPSYAIVDVALLGFILWDAAHRRFPSPFPITLAATLAMQATIPLAPHWAPYVALAHAIGLPATL